MFTSPILFSEKTENKPKTTKPKITKPRSKKVIVKKSITLAPIDDNIQQIDTENE